jgi:phage-related protein
MELKQIINWIISLFLTRYKITVSFNKEYGDSDDKTYISKKILVQKEKHLKFRDEHDRLIEFRSAAGLNYIIEDIECNKYL